jgi:NAD(P)H-flavin reductase
MKLISKILSPNKEVVYLTFQPENKVEFKAGQFMMLDN